MFTFLCLVRKIEKFAFTHLFADVMIVLTLIVVVVFGIMYWQDHGGQINNPGIHFINPTSWYDAIGFSVYSYEGIGVILPVQDVTKNPETYHRIVIGVIFTVAVIYISFGQFCVMAWGDKLDTPLITDELGEGPAAWIVKILFAVNLVFSFPLVLYPAIMIVENYLYTGWPKSKKRQLSKNIDRTLMVAFVTILTVALKQKLDKFLAILGALACTPVAFVFPSLFHFKACAETPMQKAIDLIILAFSLSVMVFCTGLGILGWNEE